MGGRAAAEAAIERARVAGFAGLVVTIDTAVAGIRERDHRNGMKELVGGGLLAKVPFLPEILSHPGWLVGLPARRRHPAAAERRDPGPGPDAAARRRRRPGRAPR